MSRKNETEWILKLRTAYPYGLNVRIEDKYQYKSGKECDDLIGKAFAGLPRVIQRDNNTRPKNRKDEISLNHKLFISQFEHCLKYGLRNFSNHMLL